MCPLQLLIAAAFCSASVSTNAATPLEEFSTCLKKSGDYTAAARGACATDRADNELTQALALVRAAAKGYGDYINDKAHRPGWVLTKFNLNQIAWETYMKSSCDYFSDDMGTDAIQVEWVYCKIRLKQARTEELLDFYHWMVDV